KFINQPEYNKWVPLLDLMEEYTSTGNPNQVGQFWGSPDVVGKARIKPFIQQTNLWTYLGPTETALITEILNRIPEGVFKELETLVYTYTYESPDITLPTPYREGCNFLGWYDNADFIGSPVTFIPSGSTGDKVFYARFDTPLGTYKVGYSLGYDGLVLPDQYVTEGEFATAPAEPTRTGYTFAGWYLGSSLYNFNTPVTANITLVAHWDEIAVYNIIYNLNGGILTSGYATRDEMIVDFLTDFHGFLQDEGVLTLDDTLLDFMHGYGYTSGYGGYYDDDTIIKYLYVKDNKAIDASTGKFINQPEYNKWVPLLDLMDDYTYVGYPSQTFWGSTYVGARRIKPFFQQINLWEKDGEPKASQIMAILNTIPEELEVDPVVSTFMSTSPDVTLPIPHRDGYDFAGWYTNESLEGSPITVIPTGTTNHVTVYAKWTTDNLSHLISTLDGASIRTEGIQGLRFYGEVDSSVKNNEHGFYLVYGSITKLELQNIADNNLTTHNGKQVYKVVVPGVTLTNQFSVVLIGIPIKGYIDGITVTAYVKVDGEVVLSDPITRCVAEVAVKAHENGEPVNDIITDIKNNIFDYTVEGNSLNIEPGYIYETDYTNLKEKFFVDWNNKFGTSLNNPSGSEFWASAKVGTPNYSGGSNYNLSQLNIYKFFNDPVYKDKWDWMLDFFLYVDITIHTSRQIYAIRGDGTYGSDKMYNANHLSYSIINFFNAAHQTGGYTAINFTSASMYDTLPNYSNVIIRKNLNVYDYFMRNSMIILPAINKTPPA
ncbi:MAG TPA: hypothetical protein GXX71_02850, partial [Acholeplasma sp.]|nr:hypothetical protein [Acholeplasma sp.]